MKMALFSPYGSRGKESGILYLVANYLCKEGAEGVQLVCDGAFSSCARDRDSQWNRTLLSCASCIREQTALAEWSTLKRKTLSSFLLPDDIVQSKKWLVSVPKTDLIRAEFRGMNLWELVRDEYEGRFGQMDLMGAASGREEDYLRELCVASVHALVAVDRLISTVSPTLHLIGGAKDVLTNCYALLARKSGADGGVFWYDASEEAVVVESLVTGSRYTTKLTIDGIVSMRSDPRTWAPEVSAILHEMLTFLGFAPDRIK